MAETDWRGKYTCTVRLEEPKQEHVASHKAQAPSRPETRIDVKVVERHWLEPHCGRHWRLILTKNRWK